MKFLVSIIIIALVSFVASLFLPWWVIAIAGFLVSFFIPQSNGKAFLAGFLALFLLWAGISFYLSSANGHLLAHKMSMLFLKMDNVPVLIIVTGIVGGLVAGFGSLSGSMCKKLFAVKG
jgi:cbb3-type cytochrome oxidase subunit 1